MNRLPLLLVAAASVIALPTFADDKPKAATTEAKPAPAATAKPAAATTKPAAATSAKPAPTSAATNMEILREKIKADKKALIADNMDLSDAESKGFWPIYDSYQKELQKTNQRIGKLVTSYSTAYNQGPVSDEISKKLVTELLAIESSELEIKKSFVPKLEKVLPAYKVARYVQIENKIRAAVKYELALEIPLID
jgi:hypothetical protein